MTVREETENYAETSWYKTQTIKYEKHLPDGWDIQAYWCIYASVDRISIAWCNDLSRVLQEAIIWTSADLLSIVPKIKPSVKF